MVAFYGNPTLPSYLMQNPVFIYIYIYILYEYDFKWIVCR